MKIEKRMISTMLFAAAEQKIAAGYKDKTFGVGKNCIRAQSLTFIKRMLSE